jgi:hypothetical protein
MWEIVRVKHYPLALVFLSALGACAANDDSTPSEAVHPIVGGLLVTSEYPNVVLVDSGTTLCSGTLIGPRTVLTAGHCVMGRNPADFEVKFGNTQGAPTMTVDVAEIRVDRRFSGTTFPFDAAVLRLAQEVTSVSPVVLDTSGAADGFRPNDTLRAVGFGFTTGGANDAGTKRSTLVPILSVGPDFIFLGDMTNNICQGDSGGPQFADVGGQERQVSISSFTRGDRCTLAAGGVRVDRVLDFIGVFKDAWEGPCKLDGTCVTTCPGNFDPDCNPCGPEGTCAADCPQVDYDCPLGLPIGALCETRTECESRRCYQAPDDERARYCVPPCDPQGRCGGGQECIEMEGGLTGCIFLTPTPGSQGQACNKNSECFSGVCELKQCMWPCDPAADECPVGSACQAISQIPFACFPGGDRRGCSIGGGTGGGGGPLWLLGLGLVALVSAARRARRPRR